MRAVVRKILRLVFSHQEENKRKYNSMSLKKKRDINGGVMILTLKCQASLFFLLPL